MNRWMVALALLTVPGMAAAQSVAVTGSSFYAEGVGKNGARFRVASRRIAYVPGTSCYTWELRFKPGTGTRALRERLVLPGPAEQWDGVDDTPTSATQLSAARDVGETDLVVDLASGMATNGWCVAEGDPQGRYRIDVTDGARRLARFDFVVGAAAAGRSRGR